LKVLRNCVVPEINMEGIVHSLDIYF
jgi:hypothetical protein